MEKVSGICPSCHQAILVNPEKETCFCVKCGKGVQVQQSIQLFKELGESELSQSPSEKPRQITKAPTRPVGPREKIKEMFQLCGSEEDFLNLRSRILDNQDISDYEKARLLEALDQETEIRLKETKEKAEKYHESQESPSNMLVGCIAIAVIGLLINYFRSTTLPGVIMCFLAVFGYIGNMSERKNTTKIAENKRAAELIQAYRDKGYKI